MSMYTFKKVANQWWFLCDNMEQLLEYQDKTYHLLFQKYINAIKNAKKEDEIYLLAKLVASSNNTSIFQGLNAFIEQSLVEKMECIHQGKSIWLNEDGGWNLGFPKEQVIASVTKQQLVFPIYFKEDIRIKKFMGQAKGTHFYAYIGKIEVCEFINGEKQIKWNTYEEAYERALRYCYSEE